jgi:hypothetical protein
MTLFVGRPFMIAIRKLLDGLMSAMPEVKAKAGFSFEKIAFDWM